MKRGLLAEAKRLHREGYSTHEISSLLKISRSTAALWVRGGKRSQIGQKRFDDRLSAARIKGVRMRIVQKDEYLKALDRECRVLKNRAIGPDESKAFLSLLYWGEGSKSDRSFYFTNSDPEMISVYLKLLRSAFAIKEEKLYAWLHLHPYHERHKMIEYWSKITGIAKDRIHIYNKVNSGVRKKADYKGCISVRYNDYRLFDEVMLIIRRFVGLKI